MNGTMILREMLQIQLSIFEKIRGIKTGNNTLTSMPDQSTRHYHNKKPRYNIFTLRAQNRTSRDEHLFRPYSSSTPVRSDRHP